MNICGSQYPHTQSAAHSSWMPRDRFLLLPVSCGSRTFSGWSLYPTPLRRILEMWFSLAMKLEQKYQCVIPGWNLTFSFSLLGFTPHFPIAMREQGLQNHLHLHNRGKCVWQSMMLGLVNFIQSISPGKTMSVRNGPGQVGLWMILTEVGRSADRGWQHSLSRRSRIA